MKYDRLEQARKELDALEREHHSTVHRANVAVKASRAKLDAARRKIRAMEFAVVEFEITQQRAQR
jgi:hypothetical protein